MVSSGSSPLSWGILLLLVFIHVLLLDHPRSRGEYPPLPGRDVRAAGSSPLSRGIPLAVTTASGQDRIIPALAGNTPAAERPGLRRTDHPRSRGEYRNVLGPWVAESGSSPLSRGIRCHGVWSRSRDRIIPALAGNTESGPLIRCQRSDHPRSRGEYLSSAPREPVKAGSSPLSRGIPTICDCYGPGSRIIPALAGNTSPPRRSSPLPPDHPRSRGEYPPFVLRGLS